MSITATGADLYITRLTRDAMRSHGVPEDVARAAARATRRNLSVREEYCWLTTRRRLRRYYWGVVSNKSLRSRDPRLRDIRNTLLRATVSRELAAAGYSSAEADAEIREHYPHLCVSSSAQVV